jgi:hypothetical protein
MDLQRPNQPEGMCGAACRTGLLIAPIGHGFPILRNRDCFFGRRSPLGTAHIGAHVTLAEPCGRG